MKVNTKTMLAVGAGVGLFILYRESAGDVKKTAKAAVNLVNPTSRDNIIYRTINAVGDSFDDGMKNESYSLGASIYEITH